MHMCFYFKIQKTKIISFTLMLLHQRVMKVRSKLESRLHHLLAHPGAKKKKVVILYTEGLLVDDSSKDTIIPITIRAYAMDDKETIVVDRHSTFVFPRKDIYDAK